VVQITAAHTGVVQLANCSFWGPHEKIISADGTGTVSLSQCNFVQWDQRGRGLPAVEVSAAASSSRPASSRGETSCAWARRSSRRCSSKPVRGGTASRIGAAATCRSSGT
jgi:hypothetical protein